MLPRFVVKTQVICVTKFLVILFQFNKLLVINHSSGALLFP